MGPGAGVSDAPFETVRRFNEIREEEARRIARALHDESAQALAAVQLALDDAASALPAVQRAKLARVTYLLEEAQQRLRHLAHELAPVLLTEQGLKEALRYLTRGFMDRYQVPVRLRCGVQGPLSSALETAVYRIVQEAVANACKHAEPGMVRVDLREDGRTLRLSVVDDGRGFDPLSTLRNARPPGLGLSSLRERAESLEGEVRIVSSPGHGTSIVVQIPLRRQARPALGGPSTTPVPSKKDPGVSRVYPNRACR